MPKFRVAVKVFAVSEYEVEVEAPTEARAEAVAVSMWRGKTSADFQVDKIDSHEAESTQLTWHCEECAREIPRAEHDKFAGCCEQCDAEWKADEARYAGVAGVPA